MLLGEILIYSGPITYILVWIIYLIIVLFFDISNGLKYVLFTYALVPWGAIFQSGLGYLVSLI